MFTAFYGRPSTVTHSNIVRDEFELALLKETLRQNKPVMAICRSLQLVNVGGLSMYIDNHWQGLPFGTSHSIRTEKRTYVVERLLVQSQQIEFGSSSKHQDLALFRATAF